MSFIMCTNTKNMYFMYLGDLKPKHQQYFQNPTKTNIHTGVEGRHTELFYNTSSRCGVNNNDCQEKLSLAMWIKNDLSKYKQDTASTSREGNYSSYQDAYFWQKAFKTQNVFNSICFPLFYNFWLKYIFIFISNVEQ